MHFMNYMALLALALIVTKILSGLADRLRIPSVLIELTAGIVLGNLGGTIGVHFASVESAELIRGLSELGVLFLLFLVGLETNIAEMKQVGKEAFLAAILGVIAPFALAFGVIPFFMDNSSLNHTLFIAAALTATSVGITARVLSELGSLKSVSGRIVLGAAVIDDVLGIIVLAIVSTLVSQGSVSGGIIGGLLLKMTLFGIAMVGFRWLLPRLLAILKPLEVPGTVVTVLIGLCLLAAWGAEASGLAGIVGAFALGLALENTHFHGYRETSEIHVDKLLKPVADFLVPIFFIVIGMRVKLSAITSGNGLTLAGILIVCAILGKLACGLALGKKARAAGGDRLLVGLGMMPRGEVGLIFAVMGERMGVLNGADYGAIVAMAAVTTLIAPMAISWRCARLGRAAP
jgi:Kef-type K+ transport system membrane component KefB